MNVDLTHMVNPSKFKYQTHKYCVEGRNRVTGALDTSIKLPFMEATEWQLIDYYWNNSGSNEGRTSQEEICMWYNNQGIFFRPKTW